MKVKEIMVTAAELCGRQDLSDFLTDKNGAEAAQMRREEETLLRCYNLAENEIALDYLPLRAEEEFLSDGTVLYGAFRVPPLEIVAVYAENGARVRFVANADGVRTPAGKVRIAYTYRPRVKTASDDAELCIKGDGRLLALGTASEFALMSGMFDAASLLDRRYRDALACACRERGGRLKMRCWL